MKKPRLAAGPFRSVIQFRMVPISEDGEMDAAENRRRVALDLAEKGSIDYGKAGGRPNGRTIGKPIERRAQRRAKSGRKVLLHHGAYSASGRGEPTERPGEIRGVRRATAGLRVELLG